MNAYESLRMLGDHAAIIANWWQMAFVRPFIRYSRQCKISIKMFMILYAADDIVIFANSAKELQQSLISLLNYCNIWKLTLNISNL